MSKYGTYKVVGGKVVQVTEAEPYEPEPVKLAPPKVCHCSLCQFDEFMKSIEAEAGNAPVTKPVEEPKVYTGVYL